MFNLASKFNKKSLKQGKSMIRVAMLSAALFGNALGASTTTSAPFGQGRTVTIKQSNESRQRRGTDNAMPPMRFKVSEITCTKEQIREGFYTRTLSFIIDGTDEEKATIQNDVQSYTRGAVEVKFDKPVIVASEVFQIPKGSQGAGAAQTCTALKLSGTKTGRKKLRLEFKEGGIVEIAYVAAVAHTNWNGEITWDQSGADVFACPEFGGAFNKAIQATQNASDALKEFMSGKAIQAKQKAADALDEFISGAGQADNDEHKEAEAETPRPDGQSRQDSHQSAHQRRRLTKRLHEAEMRR